MKKYFFAAIVLLFTLPTMATNNGNRGDRNEAEANAGALAVSGSKSNASSRSNSEATGVGVGVGIGKGGDGGNAKSYASGGDAYAKGGNARQGQGQSQGQQQGQVNLQGQDTDVDASSRNKNANSNSTYISDYEFEHNYSDDDVSTYVGGDTDLDYDYEYNSTEQDTNVSSDDDVTVEGDTTIIDPPPAFAAAGLANTIGGSEGCRILGFDFRGSGQTQARGASFGIPLPCGDTKLDDRAKKAFALGNNELGWMLTCAQKTVYRGFAKTYNAINGTRLTRDESIQRCFATAPRSEAPEVVDTSDFVTSEQLERAFQKAMTK